MKKQSERPKNASNQLGFELTCPPQKPALSSKPSAATTPCRKQTASILDLGPALRQREADSDRALLKAIQTRAAHLTDCLFKRP